MEPLSPEIQKALFDQALLNATLMLIPTVASAVAIWRGIRREPPLDRDLEALRLEIAKRPTHEDCTKKHSRLSSEDLSRTQASAKAHDDQITQMRGQLADGNRQFLAIERTLGRIEAAISALQADVVLIKK